jgi:WD40 repeat protein
VWDLQTRQETAGSPLRGHYGWVWSATFAPDGKQLVTTGEDGRAIVWSFDSAEARADLRLAARKVFLGHQGPVFTAAISPDGKQIASGGYDKRVLVWQPELIAEVDLRTLVATSQPLAPQPARALEGHTGPVRTIRFSGGGEYVISGGDDNTLRVWDSLTGRPHAQLRGHSRPVQACAVSPDGRQLLSGGQEGEVKLWDLVDYRQAPQGLSLAGHADSVLAAAFSRDGSRLITAGGDHAARVFDAATGQCSATLREGHDFLASRAIYFDGGRRLITAGGDRTVRIWDAASGTQLGLLEQTGRNATVAVSGDGRWILTGNTAGDGDQRSGEIETRSQLALWQLDADRSRATRQLVADASFGTGHPALVTALAVSPNGELLFSGDEAGGGRIWNTATGSLKHRLRGHTSKITAAAFLPNGQRVLTASHDGTVAQWDVATGQELPGMLVHGDAEHRDAFDTPVVAIAVSPDGRDVVTLAEETAGGKPQSVIRRWNLAQAALLGELYRGSDALSSLAYAAAGRAVLAAGTVAQAGGAEGGLVRRFDLSTGREVTAAGGKPFLDLTDRPEGIWSAIEAPGGDGVLTVGGNGAALWSSASAGQAELVFKPHSGVTATGFSARGTYAVTGSTDRRVKIWNVATGLAETQLPLEHTAPISSAQFSPVDEDLVLSAAEDGVALVWNWRTRNVLHRLSHHTPSRGRHAPLAALFSPDGTHVLTGGADGKLQLWNVADGSPVADWQAGAPIQAVAMSADGKQILAGLASGQAVVFDAATKTPLVRYAGHTDAVTAVAFSPEGRRVLTGSRDRLVKIWEAATGAKPASAVGSDAGKELLTLRYHEQAITSVAFAPDGRSILSTSFDGTAIVWPTAPWQAAP